MYPRKSVFQFILRQITPSTNPIATFHRTPNHHYDISPQIKHLKATPVTTKFPTMYHILYTHIVVQSHNVKTVRVYKFVHP